MRLLFATFVGLVCLAPLSAQPKPAFVPLPQAPTLSGPPTLGMQRGTMAEVTLPGANLNDAVSIYTTAPGVTAIVHPSQTDPTKVKATLAAAADGPIGLFQLRVATKHGISNFRPFCLDDLPEVAKTGDISKKEKAQVLAGPCVVTGTVAVESADYFKVSVKPGQKLMLEVLARRIGSPTDPVIILHDAKTLRELPALYADDTPGLQGDCRLSLPNKDATDYIVEVRDMTYQGGPTFGYRLRFGEFPAATTAFPLAFHASDYGNVGFAGAGLTGLIATPNGNEMFGGVKYASPRWPSGPRGWPVPMKIVNFPVSVEKEPNDTPETANPITVPGGVSASFGKKGDKDHFRFLAGKGAKYIIEATTAELGAATEVYIRILDKAGKELVASDPQKVAARVEVTAAEDGPLIIACEHLLYLSGPNEVYFLTVKQAGVDFDLTVGTDRVDVPSGGTSVVPITGLNRLNGYAGPIFLAVRGEGLSGSATVPDGLTPTADKPFLLPIVVDSGSTGVKSYRIEGTAEKTTIQGIRREASAAEVVKAGLSNLAYTPLEMQSQFVAGVYDPRFLLTLPPDALSLKPGDKAKVKLTRTGEYTGEVALSAVALPANVTMAPATLKAGAKEVDLELSADAKAPAGVGRLVIRGQVVKAKGKEKDPDYAVYGVGGEITVLGEAKKEPAKKK